MILRNLYCVADGKIIDVHVLDGKITMPGEVKDEQILDFENAIVFPGLINSHDHLDFNLFPRLGNRIYGNYVEWSRDIQKADKDTIEKVLKVPKHLRVKWGIYKNLLAGVTTVVNHGATLQVPDDLINVFQQCYSLHSIQLEPHWKRRLLKPFRNNWPFAIHIGEGTDELAKKEIDTLIKWNLLNRELIGIHGVAMDERQAKAFKGLVWCPESNYFLVGETADISRLKNNTAILFGTDSTLSADWDIWAQLRMAHKSAMLSERELFDALTVNAADVWGMKQKGKLQHGFDADIVVARKGKSEDAMSAFYEVKAEDILLVMSEGRIRLFDAMLYLQMTQQAINMQEYSEVTINGIRKYVWGDLPMLMKEVKQYYKEAIFPVQ